VALVRMLWMRTGYDDMMMIGGGLELRGVDEERNTHLNCTARVWVPLDDCPDEVWRRPSSSAGCDPSATAADIADFRVCVFVLMRSSTIAQ
jgi:hypothetical protein